MGKVIYWKLSNKFKIDHKNEWYTHNSEYVSENETRKLLWDFEIQSRPDDQT